jgi:hypothetical protein
MPGDVDLLDELDDSCWCGRTEEECEEAGGCRWTRALAEREQSVRAKVAQEIAAEAHRYASEFAQRRLYTESASLNWFADKIATGARS